MRFFLVLVFLFGLLVDFSHGETAKEAHDRSVECMKKCAKQPSVIRCELGCKKAQAGESVVASPHSKKDRVRRKIRPSPNQKKEPQHVVPAKATTIKGRRVYLVRKN